MKTSLFIVNNVGDPEPIVTTIECSRVQVGEDPSITGWPTVDYRIKGVEPNSEWVQCPAGTKFEFVRDARRPSYGVNRIIGYVETLSGSTTFLKVEQ